MVDFQSTSSGLSRRRSGSQHETCFRQARNPIHGCWTVLVRFITLARSPLGWSGTGPDHRAKMMSVATPFISASRLALSVRDGHAWRRILGGVNLSVSRGDTIAVVGPNGSGKSTLLRALLGFHPVHRGTLTIGGISPAEYRRRYGIGYVPESVSWPAGWSIGDVLSQGVTYSKRKPGPRPTVELACKDGRIPPCWLDAKMDNCSKGMRQRTMLAFALIGAPDTLLLDEPFSGLDHESAVHVRGLLREGASRGMTILVASHLVGEVEQMMRRTIVVSDGGVREATPDQRGGAS